MESRELVVDADGHVVELPGMWIEHLAPEFRGRAPRYTTDENGRFCLVLGDTLVARFAYDLSTRTSDDWQHAPHREGGWNPKRRLLDMDAEGIDRAVLFPSLAFFACEAKDPALDAALCRAYNAWVAEYCRAAPERLFAVALLPLRDLTAALRELERATGELGLRGAFVRPNPLAGRPLHHPAYEPLWECAGALDVPITVHEGLSDTLPTLGRDLFRRQCFVSCDPDDTGVRAVAEAVGDECIVWASDYPHPDAHFPGTLTRTRDSLAGIPEASRRRILGENALRLYGLASG